MRDDQKTGNRPLTIGVLVSHLTHKNDCSMWQGVVDAARKRDVNAICFVGLWLHSPYGFEAQANVIYDLVSTERLDGLVIMAGAISQFAQPEEKRAFIECYHPLPIVTLENGLDRTLDIYVDSLHNMRKAVHHLIQVHNYRRIAFIRGPENHQGANERYRAYVETLAEYGLPLDPALVSPPLNWYDGHQGISWLMDQQVDFEAVIGANDDLATGAIEELHTRGIPVPEEVAVVGYDDAAQSRWIAPPLTTVPIETYKWGQQALDMVLALIEGQPVPEQVVIPTELIVRQSCGCMDPAVMAAGEAVGDRSGQTVSRKKLQTALTGEREKVVAEMAHWVGNSEEASRWAERALDSFVAALTTKAKEESPTIFLRALKEIFYQVRAAGGDVAVWQGALSVLRLHLLPYLSDDALLRAENLWQQARVLIGETAKHVEGYQALQAEQRDQTLREMGRR